MPTLFFPLVGNDVEATASLQGTGAITANATYELAATTSLAGSGSGAFNISQIVQVRAHLQGTSTLSFQNHATVPFIGSGATTDAFCTDDGFTSLEIIPEEMRLRSPFPYRVLEEFRLRTLNACSKSDTLSAQGRAVMTFVHETELKAIFDDLLTTRTFEGHLCDRRRATEVDKLLRILVPLYDKAYEELKRAGVPDAYISLIRGGLESSSFMHRISAACAAVLLTAILLYERETAAAA